MRNRLLKAIVMMAGVFWIGLLVIPAGIWWIITGKNFLDPIVMRMYKFIDED